MMVMVVNNSARARGAGAAGCVRIVGADFSKKNDHKDPKMVVIVRKMI